MVKPIKSVRASGKTPKARTTAMSEAKVRKLLQDSPVINPRTGRLWRLTDDEIQPQVDALRASLVADPAKALEFLKRHKLVTPSGKVPRKYGGR